MKTRHLIAIKDSLEHSATGGPQMQFALHNDHSRNSLLVPGVARLRLSGYFHPKVPPLSLKGAPQVFTSDYAGASDW